MDELLASRYAEPTVSVEFINRNGANVEESPYSGSDREGRTDEPKA